MPQRACSERDQGACKPRLLPGLRDSEIHIVFEPNIGTHVPCLKHLLDVLSLLIREYGDVGHTVPFGLAGNRIIPVETETAQDAGTLSHQPNGVVFETDAEAANLDENESRRCAEEWLADEYVLARHGQEIALAASQSGEKKKSDVLVPKRPSHPHWTHRIKNIEVWPQRCK